MENNIVLIHAGIAVLFMLLLICCWIYYIVRSLIDPNRPKSILSKSLKLTFIFLLISLIISGIYPLIALGKFELYHFLKLSIFGLIWLLLISYKNLIPSRAIGLSLILLILSGISSFTDAPKLSKKKLSLESLDINHENMSDLVKGKLIYTSQCVLCHGEGGRLGRFDAADLSKTLLSLEDKIKTITIGIPLTVMTSFNQILAPNEIVLVAKYVETLKEN